MKVLFAHIYILLSFLIAFLLIMELTLPKQERETYATENHAVTNDSQPQEEEREQISEFLDYPALTINGLYPPLRILFSFPSFSTSHTIDIPYPPPEG